MIKKTKFYIGIALLVQAITFLILFIMVFNKKRSLGGAILAIAAAGGIAGAILVYKQAVEEFDSSHLKSIVEDYEQGFSNDIHDDIILHEVPVDDTVDETEFI
jgi:hypothetical protein